MNEKFREYLTNIPYAGEDSYKELSQLVDEKLKLKNLTNAEHERLCYELNIIKETDASKLFLFIVNALKGFSPEEYCFLLKENNCFINYFLDFTSVNPVKYGLQFELFFNPERSCPKFCFYIKKGRKEQLLKNICGSYKVGQLIKGNDSGCRYFIDIANNEKIDCNLTTYIETTAETSAEELAKRGLFEFDVIEYENNTIIDKDFSDEEIYIEAIRTVAYRSALVSMSPLRNIDEIKEILSSTDNRLLFQEQVIEILNRVCGFNPIMSDCVRKAICTKKQNFNKKFTTILQNKYGTGGDDFAHYLVEVGKYTVSKGYVVARMKNNIVWERK